MRAARSLKITLMANVVKIYEVRSLGFDQLSKELKSIETSFDNIKKAKKDIQSTGLDTKDAEKLAELNKQLAENKIRTAELRIERQKIVNDSKATQNAYAAQTAAVNANTQATKAAVIVSKAAHNAIVIEAGGITDLTNKRKLLAAQIKAQGPGSTGTISFGGQNLSQQQAIAQYQALNAQVQALTANVNGTTTAGTRMQSLFNNAFNTMRGSLGALILTYTGWFAAFRQVGELINSNIKLSDSFADLQIRIKGSKEDVAELFEELKKIDTRTSLVSLVDIANIVAKKGVAKEEIAGLTAEFDKLNVVLGKEIGDPATAAASIIKLISIFNDDKHITAARVNEIGTSLFKLTTTGVATGEFLINFAERVGAVRGITGLTLPNILGMGAALQQLGQRVEVSSTAMVQLTTRLFSDVPKYAQAAGVTVEAFRKILDENPAEALVQVAQGLADITDDQLAKNFEDIVTAFADVNVTGVRIKTVLADIATNGEFVRSRMAAAKTSLADLSTQTDAATLKQNTFAATLEKVRKALEVIGTDRTVQSVLSGIATVILFLVSNMGIIIPIIATYGAIWAIANVQMIAARVSAFFLNAALNAQYAALLIGSTFTKAYTASLLIFTGVTNGARNAMLAFNAATKGTPWGLVIGLAALVVALFVSLKAKAEGATEALRAKALSMKVDAEITERANDAIAEQVSNMETLVRIISSVKTSYEVKRAALDKLIESNGKFSSAISGNVIDLNKLKQILGEVRAEMLLNAKASASADLATESYKKYLEVLSTKQVVETESAGQARGPKRIEVNAAQQAVLERAGFKNVFDGVAVLSGVEKEYDLVMKALSGLEDKALSAYGVYIGKAADLQEKVEEISKTNKKKIESTASSSFADQLNTAKTETLTIPQLEAFIKGINTERDKLKEGDPKLASLLIERNKFQARLDALNPNKTKAGGKGSIFTGSRLTGDQKDDFSEIDAAMKRAITVEETRFAALQLNNRATFSEEIDFTENIARINQRYLDQKIARLETEKSLNAKEKDTLATFRKDRIDTELKMQKDVQAIRDRDFVFQRDNLKTKLDIDIQAIESGVSVSDNDASKSAVNKAKFKLDADNRVLALQVRFNEGIDNLEKQLNQRSKDNADAGAKTREEIAKDTIELFNAQFKDAADAGANAINGLKSAAASRTIKVLESNKSPLQIAREIAKIQADLDRQTLVAQVAQLKIELDLFQQGKDSKLKSEKEYQDALAKYKQAEAKLVEDNLERELSAIDRFTKALKNIASGLVENLFGIKKYADTVEGDREKQKDAESSFNNDVKQAANEAYQQYFTNLRNKADVDNEFQTERLNKEKELTLARASSEGERESIEKRFAAKKKELDRKTGEEKKRIALKELAIDFAVSIIKSISQYGLPLALIPIAGATILYAVQRGIINQTKFEQGGIVPTKTGGPITGRSHAHGGVKFNYEAEDRELAILTRRASDDNRIFSITGTGRQIASRINELSGGISFAHGASSTRRFADGGILGSSFPAPVYRGTGVNNYEMLYEVRNLAIEQSKRIDRLTVVQVTETVTDAQKKQVKQNQIGILA